ncbi:DUF1353 domain-containing protein [Pseudomonas sp. PDM15]|uniref:DUF1353 domain-containing protein n=1 Tax=Pseudomonas sp. PDM15 TaxID=2769303 RepID=UPI00178539D1|nr:DUF1353 domain-containing protein [Pseudomonas sp. PDM15]MBD9424784.1 DUF1353 domain-containing protein [Pseudomonas sp. PDM15]
MSRYPFFDHPLDTRYDWQASDKLGKDHWRVLVPFRLMLSERQWVHVPAGMLSDGGSIPRLVQNMVSPWGKLGQAYVMHDQLCEYLSLTVDGRPVPITRQRCDELLYVAMQVLGATPAELGTVRAAVDLYRRAAGVTRPSSIALKRSLEAGWQT